MKLLKQTLLIFTILSTITSCHAQLEGKYRSILETVAKDNMEMDNIFKLAEQNKEKKQTNKLKQEYIKEYKKDGTFTGRTINKYDKSLNFLGKYEMVNDSIYMEFIEYDRLGNLNGEMLPMKYEIRNNILVQIGKVYYKVKGSRNTYFESRFISVWEKIKD